MSSTTPSSRPRPARPGEIYLSGRQLAEGYLARPALTAERFVANPAGEPGSRLYRTGDLGRRRPDGAVEYLGRTDSQIKFRGHRVELGEIESALCTHPDVAQAAVVLTTADDGGQRLTAHVVDTGPGGASPAVLGEHLRELVPGHMVPSAWVFVDSFPLTANGKLDRAALRPPEPAAPPGGDTALAGCADVPASVAVLLDRLIKDVLGLDGHTPAGQGFVAMGGDSISAMRLVERARREGLRIDVADVLGAATAADLARAAATTGDEPAAGPSGGGSGLLSDLGRDEFDDIAANLHPVGRSVETPS